MKRIDRLRMQLEQAEQEYRDYIRQYQRMPPYKIQTKVEMLRQKVKEAEDYEPKLLAELLDKETIKKHEINYKIIRMHLACDFLNECAFDLRQELAKLNLHDCSLFKITDQIETLSRDFNKLVCNPNFASLEKFICNDEEYIDSMLQMTDEYMKYLKMSDNNDTDTEE